MTLVSCSGLAAEFGGQFIFEDITWQIARGERHGVIGRNGCGKTTFTRFITGESNPDRGSVARVPGLRFAVMDQFRDMGSATTVWDAAARGFAEIFELERELARQSTAIGEAGDATTPEMLERYSVNLERFEHAGGYMATARVDAVLAGMGFDPEIARSRDVATLSGGERGRLALTAQLAAPADVLILDEPTNHLDIATAKWLESYLLELDEAVVFISHDRAFIDGVADHILHFEGGTATPYTGNYDAFALQHTERRMSLERAIRKQNAKIANEQDFIDRNIAGQKSTQAKGRRRRLERLPRLSPPPGAEGVMSVSFAAGARGGDQVLVTEKLEMQMGDRQLLEPCSIILRRGDVVGLIGTNGAGKSTLLKTLLGERAPDGGSVRLMPSIDVAYYRQDLGDVDPNATMYELIAVRRPAWNRGQVQGHLGRFGFSGGEVQRKAGTLSGGERARVALALMMLTGANLLVFDEPTNHLDVESIEALEDALEEYDGTALLVTHDRALLRGLATRIWSLEAGVLEDFPGTYSEFEATQATRREALKRDETERRDAARNQSAKSAKLAKSPVMAAASPAKDRNREREAAKAEEAVTASEARLARLEAALADPSLYTAPNGREKARTLGLERDEARRALDAAMSVWEKATSESTSRR